MDIYQSDLEKYIGGMHIVECKPKPNTYRRKYRLELRDIHCVARCMCRDIGTCSSINKCFTNDDMIRVCEDLRNLRGNRHG